MTSVDEEPRLVSASCEMAADAAHIFELIADPTQQPRWDGNDNLVEAPPGQRIRAVGDVFTMRTTKGNVRANQARNHQGTSGDGSSSRSIRRTRVSPTPTTGPS